MVVRHVDHVPSQNYGERESAVDMIILHYTGMASEERALKWLCDPESGVSCHYFIFESGRICQLVDEQRRAWHAGKSSWEGITDTNSRSIGIEITNPGHEFGYRPFPDAQIAATIALCRDLMARFSISPEHVLAHSDVAPMRKMDPGELFPWQRLAKKGVGVWPIAETINAGPSYRLGERGKGVAKLRADLASYGYGVENGNEFDTVTEAVISALQRHFRPSRVDGIADSETIEVLRALLAMRRK
jgi:N-acetylmuramoyl-L-alanine amidase